MTARAVSPAEIVLRGLDAMEVIVATPDPNEAAEHARSMLDGLDEEGLRRVAAYLAHMAVRVLVSRASALKLEPGWVHAFIEKQRLEALGQLPEHQR